MARKPAEKTEMLVTRPARTAPAAGDRRVERDAFTRARPVSDDADELVPEDERALEDSVPDAAVLEPVQVGTAEPDGADAQEQLVVRGRGGRLVVQAQVVPVVQTHRDHRGCP
jgi:hypothetical protein